MKNYSASSTPLRLLGPARSHDADAGANDGPRAEEPRTARPTPPLLDEPSLFYDPPYDHSVHDEFAWHLVKYLKPGSGLRYQVADVPFETVDISIDFVVECGPLRMGFMCGASEAGAEQDRLLDAVRIRHAGIDVLYRLRACDIEQHLHDALLLVAKWDEALFSERGHINLNTLATPEARAAHPRIVDTAVTLRYESEAEGSELSSATLRMQRLSHAHPAGWMAAYERACARFDLTMHRPPHGWARSA